MRRAVRISAVLSSLALATTLSAVAPPVAQAWTPVAGVTADASTAGSLAEFEFHDTFDGAINKSAHYGLNSLLAQRQDGPAAPIGYVRKSGHWTSSSTIASANQVNNTSFAGRMSFHQPSGGLPTSAVQLDAPLVPSRTGFRVSANVRPLTNDDDRALGAFTKSPGDGWVSLVFTPATSNGWVAADEVELGVEIRSQGQVILYRKGHRLTLNNNLTEYDVPRQEEYAVDVTFRRTAVAVTVNGVEVRADNLGSQLGGEANVDVRHHLLIGTYYRAPDVPVEPTDPAYSTPWSTVDDLRVWRVSSLQHYGHYWTSSTAHGDHLADVDGHTNLNWVRGTEFLDACGFRECVLDLQFTFFKSGTHNRQLNTDIEANGKPFYINHWNTRVAEIEAAGTDDRIGAFYLIDEPYWNPPNVGAYPPFSQLQQAIDAVRTSYPNIPIMTALNHTALLATQGCGPGGASRPKIECLGGIPSDFDWIGVDSYQTLDQVATDVDVAQSMMFPHQRLFLVPQSHVDADNAVPDTATSGPSLAKLQQDYLNLADTLNGEYVANNTTDGHRSVVGQLVFGRWTHNNDGTTPIPYTAGEQYCPGRETADRQTVLFHDSFDDADVSDAYGLNSFLARRQCKSAWTTAGTIYERRSGIWTTTTPPAANHNQVNHGFFPDRMTFHVGLSALMVTGAFTPAVDGLRVSADVSPLTNDDDLGTAGNAWNTLMLSGASTIRGWIGDTDYDLAVRVHSSGRVYLFSEGVALPLNGTAATYVDVDRNDTYHVDVTVDGTRVVAFVDGVRITATIDTPPAAYFLYLTNYWSSPPASPVSTYDNLMVSTRKP